MSNRLSSEEMDRLLADCSAAESESAEMQEMRQMFASLRENSYVTAERHRAVAQRSASRAAHAQPKRMVWATAFAALAVCAAAPLEVHHRHTVKATEEARLQDEAIRKQKADQLTDEALLTNIESDLSSSVAQPLQPLSVKFVSDSTGTTKGTNE